MNCQTATRRLDTRLDLLVSRVDRTIAQCRRFEEMATVLDLWLDRWSTDTLAGWLDDASLSAHDRQLALVALALKGTTRAGAIIDDYDLTSDDDSELFYQVVRIEWEQRYRERLAA